MVRGRRTRRAAAATPTQVVATTATTNGSLSPIASNGNPPQKPSSSPLAQQNGMQMMTKGNVMLVEDFCCASPKRKEYKIDELLIKSNGTSNGCGGYTLGSSGEGCTTELITTTSPTKTRMVLRGTQNLVVTNGSVSGVNGTGTVTNGRLCPVAGNEITRFLLSQAKSKSRKARKKSPNIELVNDDTCDSFTNATTLQEQASNNHVTNGTGVNGVVKMEADDEESEDNVIALEEEGAESNPHPFQMFGRMPIGEEMTDGENIFLQEPVLKLTVDEAACVLVQPKSEQNKSSSAVATALINQDSNSGDSGVVIDKLLEASQVTPKPLLAVSRQRVPTTPHRILCPSSPQLNGNGGGSVGEGGAPGDVKEEGMTVEEGSPEERDIEEEEDGEEDVQMTKRKLVLPTKEDEEDPESVVSETPQHNIKQEPQLHDQKSAGIKQEGETMKAPKTNGVSLKGSANNTSGNHQSTMEDFFKVRRSVRKTKKEVEREEQLAIEKAILRASDMGLAVKMFENKGRGIVATRAFAKGEFVVEYVGEFISIAEANKREKVYAEDQSTGCYMYYFKHKNKQYCIDATEETGKLGRLVNHSRNGNLMTRTVEVRGQPHLVLIAKEDIEEGRELNYDYGDRSKESLLHHPWLAY